MDSCGLIRVLSPTMLRVGGHLLELAVEPDGNVTGWRLLCGDCLAPQVSMPLRMSGGACAGLVVDGALRLPRTVQWPAATMAWGLVGACRDHYSPRQPPTCEAAPSRRGLWRRGSATTRSQRCRVHRVVFGHGWIRVMGSDPVLIPGGVWISVAPGHATRVETDAFGVRQVCRKTAPSWPECPS